MRRLMVLVAVIVSLGSVSTRASVQIGIVGRQHMEITEFSVANNSHGPVRGATLYIKPMLSSQHFLINDGFFTDRIVFMRSEPRLAFFVCYALKGWKFNSSCVSRPQPVASSVRRYFDFASVIVLRGIKIPIIKFPIDTSGRSSTGILISNRIVYFLVQHQRRSEISKEWINPSSVRFDSSLPREFGGSAGVIGGAARLLNASYTGDKHAGSDQSVDNDRYSRGPRPPLYLAVLIGLVGLAGFLLACVGLNGHGNALYLFGGWFIAAASGGVLVWWWV